MQTLKKRIDLSTGEANTDLQALLVPHIKALINNTALYKERRE